MNEEDSRRPNAKPAAGKVNSQLVLCCVLLVQALVVLSTSGSRRSDTEESRAGRSLSEGSSALFNAELF
jgi:hypothetical protein